MLPGLYSQFKSRSIRGRISVPILLVIFCKYYLLDISVRKSLVLRFVKNHFYYSFKCYALLNVPFLLNTAWCCWIIVALGGGEVFRLKS